VDAFMGRDEGDQSVTLKATHLDPGLCCPMHSRREPQKATDIAPTPSSSTNSTI
jgi:hypothetical protein